MSLKKMRQVFYDNETFAVVSHINPDGDAIGSSLALCETLKKMGKKVHMFTEGAIPIHIRFLWDDSYITDTPLEKYDVCVALDSGNKDRFSSFESLFDSAKTTLCIDHHITNTYNYADINYVEGDASSTGEIMYELIKNVLEIPLDKKTAEYLYCAIATDCGTFKYSCTSAKTHRVVAELMDVGIDVNYLSNYLFDYKTINQIKLYSEGANNLRLYEDGKIALTYVDYKFLDKMGVSFDDADYLVTMPRTVLGSEVGVYIKVKNDNEIKVSYRSNDYVDVSALAMELGGGGHKKAAGATVYGKTLEETIDMVVEGIRRVL